jgi:hypothetical protein
MIVELLNRFDPEPDVLLRAISAHISDEMLECISMADYGFRADEHLAALRQVRDAGTFPDKLPWCPMEVLELTRWSEPNDPNWKPGRTGESGHWMRAFSCAAILRAEHDPWQYHYNDSSADSTVIQLTMSLQTLPVDLNRHAAQCFAWLILNTGPEGTNDSIREYSVALIWFSLQLIPRVPDADLIALAQWATGRADELNWNPTLKEFPGLKAMVIGCQKRPAWEILGVQLSEFDLSDRSSDLQTWMRLIAEQLVD